MRIEENYSLLPYNSFGIDVKARWFIAYNSEEELRKIVSDEYFQTLPFLHIGSGSNLLFLNDYPGVILFSEIQGIEKVFEDEEKIELRVGAGVVWDEFVDYCVKQSWGGAENLSGIPSQIGASAIQNIGAYGVEVKDLISSLRAYQTESKEMLTLSNADCQFAYRDSVFKREKKGKYLITSVNYLLSKKPVFNIEYGNLQEVLQGKDISLQSIREAVLRVRNSKLPNPKELGNAGSFFMNPYLSTDQYAAIKKDYPNMPFYPVSEKQIKVPAAWLIDTCGLKGYQQGNVAVHDKQALVLVNKGGATGAEVASLAQFVQATVLEKFGVQLVPEVSYIQ